MLTSTCVDWPWNDAACAGLLGMLAPCSIQNRRRASPPAMHSSRHCTMLPRDAHQRACMLQQPHDSPGTPPPASA